MNYRGFDLLDAEPCAVADASETLSRTLVTVTSPSGAFVVDARSLTPIQTRDFLWQMFGRPAITQVRTFLAARAGRKTPCWVPSYQSDVELVADVLSTDTALRIRAIGYTESYATADARRHLVLFVGGVLIPRKVVGATDNEDGTETLTLESALGVNAPAASTLVSFLFFSRLASDDAELVFTTPSYAEVTLSFVDLPREVPA